MSFRILSVNCNGLKTDQRREEVFDYLKQMDYDIYCLQETHFIDKKEETIKREWNGTWFFDNHTSQSRGVAILFRKAVSVKKLEITNLENEEEIRGRCLMVEICTEKKKRYVLGCIYAPSAKDTPSFFENLHKDINEFGCENIILCGDFNSVLNQDLDCINYRYEIKPKAREKILELMNDKHLIDIFREMNPNVSAYTFDRKEGGEIKKQSRLDFFLISENLWSCFTEC